MLMVQLGRHPGPPPHFSTSARGPQSPLLLLGRSALTTAKREGRGAEPFRGGCAAGETLTGSTKALPRPLGEEEAGGWEIQLVSSEAAAAESNLV